MADNPAMRSLAEMRFARGSGDSYADVEVELTRLIFRGLIPSLTLAATGVVGSIGAVAHHFHDRTLWGLSAVVLLLCMARMVVALGFARRRKAAISLREAYRWQLLYAVPTFAYCCVVAASTRYNFQHYPIAGSRISMICTFCVCACVYARVGMRTWFLNACGLLMLFTLAVSVWETHTPMTMPAAMLIAFFGYQYCSAVENQFLIVVEQLRSRHKLRVLAEQDVLTGLANRRQFEEGLARLCGKGQPFCVLYIDLDRFKKVNDTLGHAAGDRLLIQVGERLGAAIAATDLLARLGGDEFAILQHPLLGPAAGETLAARINRAIGAVFEIGEQEVRIGASVGLRVYTQGDADPSVVLSKVDRAMYRVKQAGGGSFCLAEG